VLTQEVHRATLQAVRLWLPTAESQVRYGGSGERSGVIERVRVEVKLEVCILQVLGSDLSRGTSYRLRFFMVSSIPPELE
jgi:hypothetical protein